MSYTIGSFNIAKMNLRQNQDSGKNFRKIAEIIDKEKFDIVALQEVFTPNVFKYSLMGYLGPDWYYRWSWSEGSHSHGAAEGYAFLWNKRRVRLINEPQIYERKGAKGKLVRPPYIARFTPEGLPGGSFFEIRLINTHIAFGKPSKVSDDIGNIDYRRLELQTLAEETYGWFSTRGYGNNMPSYTIMLGDYNLCLAGEGPKLTEIIPINQRRELITRQELKTSLKRPATEKEFDPGMPDEEAQEAEISDNQNETDHYSRNYDHFSYEKSLDDRVTLKISCVEALGKYYGGSLEEYRKEISDHVPIKLELQLSSKG